MLRWSRLFGVLPFRHTGPCTSAVPVQGKRSGEQSASSFMVVLAIHVQFLALAVWLKVDEASQRVLLSNQNMDM